MFCSAPSENSFSKSAIIGLYLFDKNVVEYTKKLRKSKRGEYEITDLINKYLEEKTLSIHKINNQNFFWKDLGTINSIIEAQKIVSKNYKNLKDTNGYLEYICLENKLMTKKMIKNDLFLRALKGEVVTRPPVWMMRQAGRYLPEFMQIKNKYDFFTRCRTPELASEITLQPIRRFGMDAAILFCDILVIPQAMNIEVEMKSNFGPFLPNPIRTQKDLDRVIVPDVNIELDYVYKAIKATKELLNNEVPLIGFAGSPWTVFCYCVQGQGSKNFDKAKAFCFSNPMAAHLLLQQIN